MSKFSAYLDDDIEKIFTGEVESNACCCTNGLCDEEIELEIDTINGSAVGKSTCVREGRTVRTIECCRNGWQVTISEELNGGIPKGRDWVVYTYEGRGKG